MPKSNTDPSEGRAFVPLRNTQNIFNYSELTKPKFKNTEIGLKYNPDTVIADKSMNNSIILDTCVEVPYPLVTASSI